MRAEVFQAQRKCPVAACGFGEALVRRVRAEYQDMPGLRLTLAQAQRLFGLREDICVRVLNTVVQEILRMDANGALVRSGGRP